MKLTFFSVLLLMPFVAAHSNSPHNAGQKDERLGEGKDALANVVRVKDSLLHVSHIKDRLLTYRGILHQ